MIVFLDKFVDSSLTLNSILFNTAGLNQKSIDSILFYNGLKGSLKLEEIDIYKLFQLEDSIMQSFNTNKIKKEEVMPIENIGSLLSVRSFRRKNRLPVNNQRTHSNAQTPRR